MIEITCIHINASGIHATANEYTNTYIHTPNGHVINAKWKRQQQQNDVVFDICDDLIVWWCQNTFNVCVFLSIYTFYIRVDSKWI